MRWKHFGPDEATWEMADQIQATYPSLVEAMLFCLGVLVYVLMMLVYVHMYMDVNTTTSYVIKLHYVVCYYDVVSLCCYVGLLLSKVIIVNITSS